MRKIILLACLVLAQVSITNCQAADLYDFESEGILKNLELQAANQGLKADEAYLAQSNALFLPHVKFESSLHQSRYEISIPGFISGGSGRSKTAASGYAYGLLLEQNLFDYSSIQVLKIVDMEKHALRLSLRNQEQTTLKKIAQAYFDSLKASDAIVSAAKYLRLAKETLRLSRTNYAQKTITYDQVQLATAQKALASSKLIKARIAYRNAFDYLRMISQTHFKRLTRLKNRRFMVAAKLQSRQKWLSQALDNNITIKAYRLKLAAQRKKINKEYGDFLPKIDLDAFVGAGKNADSLASVFGTQVLRVATNLNFNDIFYRGSGISLVLKWPILEGGLSMNKLKHQSYLYSKMLLEYKNLVEGIKLQVKAHLDKITLYRAEITHAIAQVRADRSALKIKHDLYSHGKATTLDYLQYQSNYFASLTSYHEAKYRLLLNIIELDHLVGRLTLDRVKQINRQYFT